MSKIYLTKEQYEALPYKTTKVARGRTYGEVVGMLETHGIHDYRWTKISGVEILEFPLKVIRNEVEYPFTVKLTVPKLMYSMKKGRGKNAPKTMTYLENISWRIFYWYLKSRLDAIKYGISDELREFMYNVTYALTDEHGNMTQEISLGQAILENVDNLSKLTALEDNRERRVIA